MRKFVSGRLTSQAVMCKFKNSHQQLASKLLPINFLSWQTRATSFPREDSTTKTKLRCEEVSRVKIREFQLVVCQL